MKIKQSPEDFRVEEIPSLSFLEEKPSSGSAIFLLEKKGWNTAGVVKELALKLNIPLKKIGFAGNKDKQAITLQYVSVPLECKEKTEKITLIDVSLSFAGWLKESLHLGDLQGNKFEIIVRDLESEEALSVKGIKNYFGAQRFGYEENNVAVGRAFVKKDFASACKLLELEVEGNDFIGVLRKIDLRSLRLYISAYQSWLWNCVAARIEEDIELEVPGFLTSFENEKVKKLYEELFTEEGITLRDFLINSFKELSSEGTKRRLFLDVYDFSYDYGEDEVFSGKKKCKLTFSLDKGCYATIVIEALFGKF